MLFCFQNMAEKGGGGEGGIPMVNILYESISCFCYIFNNMQPLLHLRKTRMKCSLKYFALNCNFFISLVWKLVCFNVFKMLYGEEKSADHWNTFVKLSSAGTLGGVGSDCSTLRLCLVYLLKCTVFKNQT